MEETKTTPVVPAPVYVPTRPIVRSFASLGQAFGPQASHRATWKDMVQAAEAVLIEPRFALDERPDRYILKALIPGGRDVQVEVTGTDPYEPRVLVVTGTTDERFTDGNSFGYVRRRPVGASFTLPVDADEHHVQSEMKHSILHVTIPRTPCVPV